MDRKKLKQYRSLAKEEPKVKKDIDKLYERLSRVPTVSGKIMKSSDQHPYIKQNMTVQMTEPKEATEIKRQIRIKERRLEKIEGDRTEIEQFIASIQDSEERMIFESVFMNKETQSSVADELGYSKGRISQKISLHLKD